MIEELKAQLLANWGKYFSDKKVPEDLKFISYARGVNKKYDYQKIFFFVFQPGSHIPVLTIKKYRGEKFKIQQTKDKTNLYPRFIDNIETLSGTFAVEEFIVGTSLEHELVESEKELGELVENHFEILRKIVDERNAVSDDQSFSLEEELEKSFSLLPKGNLKELIQSQLPYLKELSKIKSIFRIVNGDLIPQNIYRNESKLFVIDYEFEKESNMYFIEEMRFVFYYIFLLTSNKKSDEVFFGLLFDLAHLREKKVSKIIAKYLEYDKETFVKLIVWAVIEDLNLQYKVYGIVPEQNLVFYENVVKLLLEPSSFMNDKLSELEKLNQVRKETEGKLDQLTTENINLKAQSENATQELSAIRKRKFFRLMNKVDKLKSRVKRNG